MNVEVVQRRLWNQLSNIEASNVKDFDGVRPSAAAVP